jgi:catechol 2,3-dioxygenase
MLAVSPLWPAHLDHIRYDSPNPRALADFYRHGLGMSRHELADGTYLVEAPGRRIVIGAGEARLQPYSAFALADPAQLATYRDYVTARGAEPLPAPSPLFAEGAFAVRDPDGRLALFGLPASRKSGGGEGLSGTLQHVVVASSRFPAMMAFYRDVLGFLVSDTVHADDGAGGLGDVNVCFLRADESHHSFAVFRAPKSSSDHHAYEVASWDEIRQWADHFASLSVPIWWGPGRHGAGNNLFFMVKDPDGNNLEISAELEQLAHGAPGKQWSSDGRALNLWGTAWNRDVASAS